MARFHRILVPIDFEDSSSEALDVGVELALAFDAKLILLHAWEVPTFAYAGGYTAPDLWAVIEDAATAQLATTLALVRKRVPSAESLLANGAPAPETIAAIDQTSADLVIMGTHGRRGVTRMFLGSVAENVVRNSPVPVLTIRGRETAIEKRA
jgi:nucleotide-binding universal stress UspA family protein